MDDDEIENLILGEAVVATIMLAGIGLGLVILVGLFVSQHL